MIKRAHAEERPYRLIVPVVLHFLPLAAYFRPLVRGGQEGIVPIIINRLIQDNPPQLPLLETLREQAPLTGRAAKREKCPIKNSN